MNCIFWFGNKFASYKQYKDLCRRAGEPIVLSYCSVEGQDRRASLERLGRMLDSTPDRLLGVVVDGQLDLMERVMGVVDGRAPVLFRKTNNPFRGGDAFDGGRGSFGCSWFQCAGFELDSEPLRAADSAAEFLWLSDNEMPAEAERQLRKYVPEVTVRCCSPGSADARVLLGRARYVGSDLPASWMGVVRKLTAAECLYHVVDDEGNAAGWRRINRLRMQTYSLPWLHQDSAETGRPA